MSADHRLHPIEPDQAPEDSKPLLEATKQQLGMIPNLHKVLSRSPAALEAYTALTGIYDKSSLSPAERQAVLLAVSHENECGYCMAAHTMVARLAKLDPGALEALREGQHVPDDKLSALVELTRAAVRQRGHLEDAQLEAFYDAGYEPAEVLDVVVGIAFKTLSNYVNHIVDTPVDEAFSKFVWDKKDARSS